MAASADRIPTARFENIQLLRAFAALSVVVYHVIEYGGWSDFPDTGPLAAFRAGWSGVDLFFVISGFVIAYSGLVLYRAGPALFAARYWKRRLARILPLYIATLFLWLALFPPHWSAGNWVVQLATHLGFTHGFSIATHGAIDGANWSLAIEMHFYLAVAVAIGWIDRTPAWRIAICGVLIAWAWRASMWVSYAGAEPLVLFVRTTQLPGTLDEFAAGIVLAKLVLDGKRAWFASAMVWTAGAIGVGYIAMALLWRNSASYWEIPAMVVLWRTLLGLFYACVVGAAIALPQALAKRWLRPIAYLGETSYGIYLWHLFAVNIVILRLGWTGMPALLAVLAGTIALASASWHLLEQPLMRTGRDGREAPIAGLGRALKSRA